MCKKFLIVVLFLFLVHTSCVLNPKEKEAELRLKKVETLTQENSLNSAKIELDSIHILYPNLYHIRKKAKLLEDAIIKKENKRTLAYLDSVLVQKKYSADSIQKRFRFEKEPKYQTIGNYSHPTFSNSSSVSRPYLSAYVDENADFYLISNFFGKNKLEHESVKASVKDSFAQTNRISTNNPLNYSFNDSGDYWETITFKNEQAANVPSFIAFFRNDNIKVKLEGEGKKEYIYYLTDKEKEALCETYNLWMAKKDVVLIEKEIERAKKKIELIDRRGQKEEQTQE